MLAKQLKVAQSRNKLPTLKSFEEKTICGGFLEIYNQVIAKNQFGLILCQIFYQCKFSSLSWDLNSRPFMSRLAEKIKMSTTFASNYAEINLPILLIKIERKL
jgi:hypothetical protein